MYANMDRTDWTVAFSEAYEDFVRRCEQGQYIGIDEYAATSPGEFFAVISEVFFERPLRLREVYPEVYAQLRQFYRQDPFQRLVNSDARD